MFSTIIWTRTSFLEFAHKVFISLLYESLRMIHVDLHLQYSIQDKCLYVHMLDLPIHGRFYYKNAYNGDEPWAGTPLSSYTTRAIYIT